MEMKLTLSSESNANVSFIRLPSPTSDQVLVGLGQGTDVSIDVRDADSRPFLVAVCCFRLHRAKR